MKNSTNNTLFYRLGKALGQPLAWVLQKQRPVTSWLVAKGIPFKLAKLMLIAANFLILAALLLTVIPTWAIVIVLVFAAAILAASNGVNIDLSLEQGKEEWRMGASGWGLYRGDECIIWSNNPNDPNE